ncbi:Histidine kinase of the competence regulon ComD [Vagococcus fluvialis bH819]|uniref:Histidine kinase of the competence regulon ComD n=2 Tax=Enterococcaceae TaxID=81852 RepID=A0A1X6WS88_9ENTE|nr:Histidine kinase of the competence regulon ComD [Vagococcus fluvialis bH819]
MLMVDLKAFILLTFYLNILLYGIFYFFIERKIKLPLISVMLIITFFGQLVMGNWFDVLMVGVIYLYENYVVKSKNNFIVNTYLFCLLIILFASLIASNIMLPWLSFQGTKGFDYIFIKMSIMSIILLFLVVAYQKLKVTSWLKNNNSILLTMLLLYVYCITLLVVVILKTIEKYSLYINIMLVFVILQTMVITILFVRDRKKKAEEYENLLYKNQLDSLKNYTEQLEEDYQSTRKFKHDYKNMLLSLRINVENQNYGELTTFLNELDDYSEKYFINSAMEVFKDLTYIKDGYLKSIFINKLQLMLNKGIKCQFECRDLIDNPVIDLVDLIRILSIFLDNGIEASLETEEKRMAIGLSKTDAGLTIIIANSYCNNQESVSKLMEQGYTSKANHSGLGLTNVQEIKNKYPNLFIQYEKEEQLFTVKIIIDEGVAR